MNENKHTYKDRKYNVVPYDSQWPHQFELYANKIKNIFGNTIQIEHIGSTAVPGMSGKSCIDVLVIVKNLETVGEHLKEMEQAGFEDAGQFVMKNSRLFRIMQDNSLLANIHFFPKGHPHNEEMINVRDYLRSSPNEVAAYSAMKSELYTKYSGDYAAYRKYKDEYMDALIKRAVKS